ncbi:GmrSD restriction endonuclease domain-containing protein [Actinospongicola halichondriae]|uniref:GmrSD restriction endonuclease domain-containing protein n=1 Tax=Actinospongicola halichondriae TaxID=3236844 RepID=UPI003D4A6CCD
MTTGWYSIYDGYSTPDETELEIDHVVALAEAWRSGAHAWSTSTRIEFANDIDLSQALVAVTAATNRSKSDHDPATWQPPSSQAWCEYADAWITVKLKWDLSADPAEVDALRNMLASQNC